MDRLRQGFSAVHVTDHVQATPPTPTSPTSRMHLLSGLRTAPKTTQTPAKVAFPLTKITDIETRGYTPPNVTANGYDYGMPSPNPRIVLSPNSHVENQNYYAPRQPAGHKHGHNRGSSVSSLHVPKAPSPVRRPDTPESLPDSFDPQHYASLQQQYLELVAANQYLVQQHQQQQLLLQLQQQYNMTHQMHPLAFLSPPRTPVSASLPGQYDSPSGFLSPGPERHQFQSPRRPHFDQFINSKPQEPASSADPQFRVPSPATSPSPASSESSWRRGHRRGKSSISISGNAPKQVQPIRQPYGPPPMETLEANKASGAQSSNFASRLRRKAVNRLMQAGIERRHGSPVVPNFSFHDAQGKVTPESLSPETGSDDDFDPRRRSAMF